MFLALALENVRRLRLDDEGDLSMLRLLRQLLITEVLQLQRLIIPANTKAFRELALLHKQLQGITQLLLLTRKLGSFVDIENDCLGAGCPILSIFLALILTIALDHLNPPILKSLHHLTRAINLHLPLHKHPLIALDRPYSVLRHVQLLAASVHFVMN